jgi:hypothetical protein
LARRSHARASHSRRRMSSRSSASRARHNATQRSHCAGPAHHVATKYNHGCARARAQARRERGPISSRAMERTPHGRLWV